MEEKERNELLERFMEGATTLDEERRLAEWFRRSEAGGELEAYRRMFALWDEGEVWPEPDGAPVAPARKQPRARRWLCRTAVAACLVAAVAAATLLPGPERRTEPEQAAVSASQTVAVAPREVRIAAAAVVSADEAAPSRPERPARRRPAATKAADDTLPLAAFGIESGVYVEPQAASLPAVTLGMEQFGDYLVQAYDEVCRLSPSRQKVLRDIAYIYAENTFINTTIAGCTVSLSLASLTQ
ncbi:MAG: hypothetical protein J1F06_06805 [Prevotellaceae bacterium]|nr:hypothetical protein [Prevotellaceae bacterium]